MWCKPLCTWPRKKLLIKSTLSMLNCCINWNLHSLRVMIIKKQQSIKLAVQQAQSNFLVHRIPPSIMIQLQRVYLERWSLYSIDRSLNGVLQSKIFFLWKYSSDYLKHSVEKKAPSFRIYGSKYQTSLRIT